MDPLTVHRPIGGDVVDAHRGAMWVRRYLDVSRATWAPLLFAAVLNDWRAAPLRAFVGLVAVRPLPLREVLALVDLELATLRVDPSALTQARQRRRPLMPEDVRDTLVEWAAVCSLPGGESNAGGAFAEQVNAARADGLRELRERAALAEDLAGLVAWAQARADELAPLAELCGSNQASAAVEAARKEVL